MGKACRFGKSTTIDSKLKFEGGNTLANYSSFFYSSIGFGLYIVENSFIKNTVIVKYCSVGNEVMTVAAII